MKQKSKIRSIVERLVTWLIIVVAALMIGALFVFDGLELKVLLAGGGLLIVNLIFVFYFARRNL